MKIALIYPGFTKDEEFGRFKSLSRTCMPLGLALIAAMLEQEHYEVHCIDTVAERLDTKMLMDRVSSIGPDLIGISILSSMLEVVNQNIKAIRERFPDILIIGGGPHVTSYPEHIFKTFPGLDIGVIGEGEEIIIELIKAIEKGKTDFNDISGLAFPGENNSTYLTRPRVPIQNLDILPLPARHLFPVGKYRPAAPRYKRLPSLTLYTSRGCPYRCAFCHQPEGKIPRCMSPSRVVEEMLYCKQHFGARDFEFFDANMCVNKPTRRRLIDICELLIKKKADFTWSCQTRIDHIDEEMLVYMKRAGCWNIRYGIESGVQRLLDYIQKDFTLEEARKAVYLTNKVGIEANASFIIGLPTETKEESRQTIDFAKGLPLNYAYFCIYAPRPKTKLFELAEAEGFKMEDLAYQNIWAGLGDHVPNYAPKGRDPLELAKLQKKAFKEFYLRPSYLLKQVFKLRNKHDLKKAFSGLYALVGTR